MEEWVNVVVLVMLLVPATAAYWVAEAVAEWQLVRSFSMAPDQWSTAQDHAQLADMARLVVVPTVVAALAGAGSGIGAGLIVEDYSATSWWLGQGMAWVACSLALLVLALALAMAWPRRRTWDYAWTYEALYWFVADLTGENARDVARAEERLAALDARDTANRRRLRMAQDLWPGKPVSDGLSANDEMVFSREESPRWRDVGRWAWRQRRIAVLVVTIESVAILGLGGLLAIVWLADESVPAEAWLPVAIGVLGVACAVAAVRFDLALAARWAVRADIARAKTVTALKAFEAQSAASRPVIAFGRWSLHRDRRSKD